MIVRVEPQEVSMYWPLIHPGVKKSMPPKAWELTRNGNSVLKALIEGRAQCWLECTEVDGNYTNVRGMAITTIYIDAITGITTLLIYALWNCGNEKFEDGLWQDGAQQMAEFAKQYNCQQIAGYTRSKSVVRAVETLGGYIERFVSVPINKVLPQPAIVDDEDSDLIDE